MEGPMTPEEKAMVMQFMGQTYGAVHQQDQNIVGNSGNLTPKSQELKNMFEQTARMPTVDPNRVNQPPPRPAPQPPQPAPQPEQHAPTEVKTITPEQAAQEIAAVNVSREDPIDSQGEFDFSEPAKIDKLISLIEKQTLILKEINLKLSNGKSVKTKQQK